MPLTLVVAAIAVPVLGVAWTRDGPPPSELRLPPTLVGLPVSPNDFGDDPQWLQSASTSDAEVVGRGFGGDPARRPLALNVLVMAGDSTGDWDLRMAAGSPQRFGRVSCTQTLDIGAMLADGAARPAPQHSDSRALCWRTSGRLSVSVLVFGTDPGYLPTAAQAVQEVWDLQS